jgi:methylmalonyl-CoA/ethylmalonyl-CoA epimerase
MSKIETGSSLRTGLDLSKEKIVQFSVVVRNLEKVAKRFADIFGIRWTLYDFKPARILLNGETPADPPCLKIAIGNFGGRSLKLIEPVSGQSSYAQFLEKNGEGFYTIGLGTLLNHDEVVSALTKAGVMTEMQVDGGDGAAFSIMNTTKALGCRIEFSSPRINAGESGFRRTGILVPEGPGFVDMGMPIISGGKRIDQIGIVVEDEKKAAMGFEELLGIRGWEYAYGPPGLINASMNGIPVKEPEMESLDVAFANGRMGDIWIEVIRPIGIRPGGCHQRFLDRSGNGIQHVSFGIQPDYAAVVAGMKRAGIGSEFSASIKAHGVTATYFASQDMLGGFQLEVVGKY